LMSVPSSPCSASNSSPEFVSINCSKVGIIHVVSDFVVLLLFQITIMIKSWGMTGKGDVDRFPWVHIMIGSCSRPWGTMMMLWTSCRVFVWSR
jgi:hypothetical protein